MEIQQFILLTLLQVFLYFFYIIIKRKFLNNNYTAIQKIHEGEIPRSGGLLFFVPFIILNIFLENKVSFELLPLSIGSVIIFAVSFYEDLSQSLSTFIRLIIICIGTIIYLYLTNIPEIKISIIMFLTQFKIANYILFTLSIMLIINGFNFIDGLNGLSSFNFFSILLSSYIIAENSNDFEITNYIIYLYLISALVFFLNFPFGKIFLGDSGSYLFAFISGSILILIFSRNNELPTLLAMVVLAYPITELLFSIIRKIINKRSPLDPDIGHLHHLVFNKISGSKFFRNNLASLLMLPIWLSPFFLTYVSLKYQHINHFYLYLIYLIFYTIAYFILNKKII